MATNFQTAYYSSYVLTFSENGLAGDGRVLNKTSKKVSAYSKGKLIKAQMCSSSFTIKVLINKL